MRLRYRILIPAASISLILVTNSFAAVLESITTTIENVISGEESEPNPQISPRPQESSQAVENVQPDSTDEPQESGAATPRSTAPASEKEIEENQETRTVDTTARFNLITPTSLKIDPRAKTYLLPQFRLTGSAPVLICFKGFGTNFDIGLLNNREFSSIENLSIEGERSSVLAITGRSSDVASFLAVTPIWLYSNKGLPGSYFTVSATGLSVPYLDIEACENFTIKNYISLRTLELQLGITKGKGRLK
jgi:hypothetical protein